MPLTKPPVLRRRARATDGRVPYVPIAVDRALMARTFVWLYGLGGTLVVASLALPSSPERVWLPIAGVAVAAFIVTAICLWQHERLPVAFFHILPLFGSLLIIILISAGGADAAGAYALFSFWVAVSAFYFFNPLYALLCTGLSSVGYLSILLPQADRGLLELDFMMLTGALVVSGVLVGHLRVRADDLLGELADAARTDVLTGLANRREFDERLAGEVAQALRDGNALSLIALDLDGLKWVNDRHGHQAGDEALSRFADALSTQMRAGDVLARVGGDEFAAITRSAGRDQAFAVAERLRGTVRRAFEDSPERLTMSAGVATLREHGLSPAELQEAADRALYAAKSLGRDCTVVYRRGGAGAEPDLGSLTPSAATLVSLAELVDVRQGAVGHCRRVAHFAASLAAELGLDRERADRVRLAGLLHDVGKVGVPEAYLTKPGPLDAIEENQIREHPDLGAELALNARLDDVADWIRAHHERPDGRGYPRVLGAGEIPLEAKILSVADAFEAMTSNRPYRRALDRSAAIDELVANAGAQFDPEVVDAFMRVLRTEEAEVAAPADVRPSRPDIRAVA